jgi:L-aspartate oxidase
MTRYHPDGDLAPRDVVARSIAREVERTGGRVALSLAHLDAAYVRRRFPTIDEMCTKLGLDLARDPIPVGPAAHYIMGGVDTDDWGRTSLPGLYAAGEVACTGLHGANRLASNSLLEGLVFGARAATAMPQAPKRAALKGDRVRVDGSWLKARAKQSTVAVSHQPSAMSSDQIRDLMWRTVGLFRTHDDLARAVTALEAAEAAAASAAPPTAAGWRHRNLVTVARLIAGAAIRREESRGGHFRADFPARDDLHWKVHLVDVRSAE